MIVIDMMNKLLLALMLLSPFSFADNIALSCKPSGYADYVVSIVINTVAKTLNLGSFPSYTLNHASGEYYYAHRIHAAGGEILIVSRLNGKYWRGGASTNSCTDSECSDTYARVVAYTGDCRVAF
tara:strand:+ start:1031 stop:1405 length:375 start_codon:yes stop_codon:yes gene_type:complete